MTPIKCPKPCVPVLTRLYRHGQAKGKGQVKGKEASGPGRKGGKGGGNPSGASKGKGGGDRPWRTSR